MRVHPRIHIGNAVRRLQRRTACKLRLFNPLPLRQIGELRFFLAQRAMEVDDLEDGTIPGLGGGRKLEHDFVEPAVRAGDEFDAVLHEAVLGVFTHRFAAEQYPEVGGILGGLGDFAETLCLGGIGFDI